MPSFFQLPNVTCMTNGRVIINNFTSPCEPTKLELVLPSMTLFLKDLVWPFRSPSSVKATNCHRPKIKSTPLDYTNIRITAGIHVFRLAILSASWPTWLPLEFVVLTLPVARATWTMSNWKRLVVEVAVHLPTGSNAVIALKVTSDSSASLALQVSDTNQPMGVHLLAVFPATVTDMPTFVTPKAVAAFASITQPVIIASVAPAVFTATRYKDRLMIVRPVRVQMVALVSNWLMRP